MTQPPDERDPNAADGGLAAGQSPGEQPTQAWAPPPPEPTPAVPPPPGPVGPAQSPVPNTLASGAAASAQGPTVAWSSPPPPPDVGAPGLTWSDTPTRFVAYVIDSFLVGVLAGIVASLLNVGQTVATPGQPANVPASPLFYVLSAAIGAAYFILSWSGGRRATLGQRLFNIQVGNAFDGRALTTTQAVKRWIGLGSFLGLLSIVPSPRGCRCGSISSSSSG